ncbi:hypothetical protein [Bremerella alba]|uniref:Endonuclease n=1 Tax=Bremerella alba TaxID=980252 RepID=A0A7V8V7J0_9BACT|nr:hypothetical protein [Bremerella alba]MBA2116429.1 hypothetical protein [Bremerella alba]
MTNPTPKAIAKTILNTHGETYAQQAGIRLRDAPAPLFQLLCESLLLSARISAEKAVEATTALKYADLTTPRKMAEASWQQRVEVITDRGYKRFDKQGSTQLGQTADFLLKRYYGDLRQLRAEARHDVGQEKRLLQQFQGVGPVGAEIFLREVQGLWGEVYPFADAKVTDAAKKLELPSDPQRLARLVQRSDFPRLVAGILRVDLAKQHDEVLAQAV